MRIYLFALFSVFTFFSLFGQTNEQDTVVKNKILIDNADTLREVVHQNGRTLTLIGNVALHQDSILMYCDSASQNNNELRAYSNVILQQWDSLSVFSDTLLYFGDEKKAILTGEVILQDSSRNLFTNELYYDAGLKIASYYNGAQLKNDSTTMFSKRGTYDVPSQTIFFRDSVYTEGPKFKLYADSLKYNTNLDIAYFTGPTRIVVEGANEIYCEDGYYDIRAEKGLFIKNAQYQSESRTAVADTIYYDGESSKIELIGDAEMNDSSSFAKADRIVYEAEKKSLFLTGNAFFRDSSRTIDSDSISYNTELKTFKTFSRSTIEQDQQFITADLFDYDDSLKMGKASGNIFLIDTVEKFSIRCEEMDYQDSLGYIKAYGQRPLFAALIENDTLFLTADTLLSYKDDSINRSLIAYNNVKIFKSDLQALCDSLTYHDADSSFSLYQNPIIWSDTSQFFADTINIFLNTNKEIKEIVLIQNAMIVNSADEILFNQMRGRLINTYFVESEIKQMLLSGNAESYYYTLDDNKAYIGLNETQCSNMKVEFGNNNVEGIRFYAKPTATFHPIQSINPEQFKFDNFKWVTEGRPKSKEDLYETKAF